MERAERERLAKEHLDQVERIVLGLRRRLGPSADVDEMRSFGMFGLAAAIDSFEPSRGVPFAAYAAPRIRGAVYDGLSSSSWFPRRLQRQITFYRRADEMLEAAAVDPPPADTVETAHRLADRLKELATAYVTTSAGAVERQAVAEAPEAESDIDMRRYASAVNVCLGSLTEIQATLIRRYYYEGIPLGEIASDFGYTKSWASRALRAALQELRRSFGAPPGCANIP